LCLLLYCTKGKIFCTDDNSWYDLENLLKISIITSKLKKVDISYLTWDKNAFLLAISFSDYLVIAIFYCAIGKQCFPVHAVFYEKKNYRFGDM
jgi:hypothetical protein